MISHPKTLNLITPAKSLLPHKVTCTYSRIILELKYPWLWLATSAFEANCNLLYRVVLYMPAQLLRRVSLWPPWTVAHQASLSMGFPRQEYWSGLSFPSPGDLPNPGIKPVSLASPTLAGGVFTTWPPGKSCGTLKTWQKQKQNRDVLIIPDLYFSSVREALTKGSLHDGLRADLDSGTEFERPEGLMDEMKD